MREILFRGKTHDGEWRESSTVFIRGELAIMLNERPIKELIKDENGKLVDVIFSFCAVEKNTVGQFTGLTDMNSKKIFEGDIMPVWKNGEKYLYKVVYFGDCFMLSMIDSEQGSYPLSIKHNISKVVGNIHDNPELLKGV